MRENPVANTAPTVDHRVVADAQDQLVTLVEQAAEANLPFYIVNIRPDVVIVDDLRRGAVQGVSAGQCLRLLPGQPINLLRFFDKQAIIASMNLATAFAQGWVTSTSTSEDVPIASSAPWVREEGTYQAAVNTFDIKLADLIEKDNAEEEKLKRSSRDPLSARARMIREATE